MENKYSRIKSLGVLFATILLLLVLTISMGGCLVNKSIELYEGATATQWEANQSTVTPSPVIVVEIYESTPTPERGSNNSGTDNNSSATLTGVPYGLVNGVVDPTAAWNEKYGVPVYLGMGPTPMFDNRMRSHDISENFGMVLNDILVLQNDYADWEQWDSQMGKDVMQFHEFLIRYSYWGYRRFGIFSSEFEQYPNTNNPGLVYFNEDYYLDDPLIGTNVSNDNYPMEYPYPEEYEDIPNFRHRMVYDLAPSDEMRAVFRDIYDCFVDINYDSSQLEEDETGLSAEEIELYFGNVKIIAEAVFSCNYYD